jgi:hypothetical protein
MEKQNKREGNDKIALGLNYYVHPRPKMKIKAQLTKPRHPPHPNAENS